ncbi:unnamed protein product [Boreogadus saida]
MINQPVEDEQSQSSEESENSEEDDEFEEENCEAAENQQLTETEYEEPPEVTIMHHGMVIQLKLNPPNQDNELRKKSKTSKRYMEEENKKHPSKLKRDKRCDEDIYTFRRGRV